MWFDKELKIDFLNFNEMVELIKDFIIEKELMFISVGVFGDWGVGKFIIFEFIKVFLEIDE